MSRVPRTPHPPRLPTRVLLALLPSDSRGRSIAGDLSEEWHSRPTGVARDLWYVRECLLIGARYALVRRRLPAHRSLGSRPRPVRGGSGPLLPLDDLRFAVRSARRTPTMSALTVLALGVGVAAPTIMFSLLIGVTRPMPVPEPDRLVHIGWRYSPTLVRISPIESLRPFLDLSTGDGLASLGAFSMAERDVGGDEGFPERRRVAAVTPGVFRALEVAPSLGRAFGSDDVAGATVRPTVIIADDFRRSRFGPDATDVLGRTMRVDGTPHTVIGVMPPGFGFPDDAELWVPLDPADPGVYRSGEIVARLTTEGSLEALRARVAAVSEGLRGTGVIAEDRRGAHDATLWSDRSLDRNALRILLAMVVIVSFVLVIACADVAHLFLARALMRQRSMAVRMALGSGRWRLIRQHLAESGVLAALGGLVGIGVAAVGTALLSDAMAARLSWWMEIRLDPAVVAFATGLVMLAALSTAVLPALHTTRLDPARPLRAGGHGRSMGRGMTRATGGLVIAEVALTCTLLVVAGLLTWGALRNLEVEAGYETASVLAGGYELREDRYPDEAVLRGFHRMLTERMGDRPEVAAAALTSHLPGVSTPMVRAEVEGATYERPEDRPRTHLARIGPGYLEALGVAPLRGRDFRWSDGVDEPLVALVNEPFVRRHMAGREPLGARVRVAPGEDGGEGEDAPPPDGGWATVVGVVPNLGMNAGLDPDDTGFYLPLGAEPPRTAYLLLRAGPGAGPEALVPNARAVLAGLDESVALSDPRSLRDAMRATRDMESLFATLFGFFGISGLVLAAVGLYGLTVFTVGGRVRELGIRSALGARPRTIVWTAVRAGTLQIGAGLVVGLGIALLVSPVFGTLFMGFEPRDPVAYAVVALPLLAVGAAATLVPARRAASTDVADVLKAD